MNSILMQLLIFTVEGHGLLKTLIYDKRSSLVKQESIILL
jgi:hypothetical protein